MHRPLTEFKRTRGQYRKSTLGEQGKKTSKKKGEGSFKGDMVWLGRARHYLTKKTNQGWLGRRLRIFCGGRGQK